MQLDLIQSRITALPQVAAWPELRDLVSRPAAKRSTAVWEMPALVSRALGGTSEAALPACAAIYCSLLSIHLVDDLLDSDPRGLYHRLGVGQAANLALALEAVAHRMLGSSEIRTELLPDLHRDLADMTLATAYGQHLDGREVETEDDYWRVVGEKTPPLFRCAFLLGAAVAAAGAETRRGLAEAGNLLGKIVQVSDDLGDAMDSSASADWQRPGNNLAILYGLRSEHSERQELVRLAGRVAQDPQSLERAQHILVTSGAISYCAYRLIALAREARGVLEGLSGIDVEPLRELFDEHMKPLMRLLSAAGVEAPEQLLEA